MNGKKRLSRTQVEQVARKLLARSPLGSESPDSVFLAGVRTRIANLPKPPEGILLSIARLSWNLAPATALATLLLSVGLIREPAPVNPPDETWERLLTEMADDENTEVSQDLLIEAVLLEPRRR